MNRTPRADQRRPRHPQPHERPDESAPTPVNNEGRRQAPLALRIEVRWVTGEGGRALAAGQGRALRNLLDSLDRTEVGLDEEVLP